MDISARRHTPTVDDEESSLITPFTVLPRLLARSTAGQVAWNLVLFVALPTASLGYWICVNAVQGVPDGYEVLRLALPLAAGWFATSPLLMYFGERTGARWVASLTADADFGWNISLVHSRKRRIDLLYYPTALLGAAAAVVALAFALPSVQRVIPAPPGLGTVVLFVVFAQAGFTAVGGLNGVLRWVVVTRAAVTGAVLRWHPYRSPIHRSLDRSYRLSLMFGIMFSTGAFLVPTLLAFVGHLSPVAATLVWAFIILLLLGGVLIFVVPVVTLTTALSRGKRAFLGRITSPLADLFDDMIDTATDRPRLSAHAAAFEQLVKLRNSVVNVRVVPVGQTVGRAFLTVVLPVVSLGLSILQSGLVKP